jgi:hypothetical protein
LEPSLPVRLQPSELSLSEFISKEHRFEVWVAYVDTLKAMKTKPGGSLSPETLGSWEDVDVPTLESLSKARQTFKTPKKLKLGPLLSPVNVPFKNSRGEPLSEIEPIWENEEGEVLESKISQGIRTVMADWNKLEANFELIRLELDTASQGET